MNRFSAELKAELLKYNLLEHDFYKYIWNQGKMPMNVLKEYVCQYYHHVMNIAPSIGGIISNCTNQFSRRLLIENLCDEDMDKANGETNHITLWRNFAKSIGITDSELSGAVLMDSTKTLIETFKRLAKESFETGLGMFFAQEHNYENIAKSKGDSLCALYAVKSEEGLKFFRVHEKADAKHAADLETILDNSNFSDEQKNTIMSAGIEAMKSLNGFLDGMMEKFGLKNLCEYESEMA